jgi:hypothetical protein
MFSHDICGVVKYAGRPARQLNSCWHSVPFEGNALNGLRVAALPKKIKGTCLRNLWNTGEHTPLE